jgi:hypothetical protein
LLFESQRKIYGEAGPATWTGATVVLTKTHFWRLAATDAFLPMRQRDKPIGHDNLQKKPGILAGLFLEAGSGGRGRRQLKW